jgi:hypothetical protein
MHLKLEVRTIKLGITYIGALEHAQELFSGLQWVVYNSAPE